MKRHITERDVTKVIRDFLQMRNIWHWKVHQGLGSAPGVPDILGCYKGRLLGIEIKAPGRKVKPGSAQERFLKNLHDHGGIAIEADGIEALVAGFETYGYGMNTLL